MIVEQTPFLIVSRISFAACAVCVVVDKGFGLFVFGDCCSQRLLFWGWLLSKVSAFLLSLGLVVFKHYCFWGGCCQRFLCLCVCGWLQSTILVLGWLLSKVSAFLLSLGLVVFKDYLTFTMTLSR